MSIARRIRRLIVASAVALFTLTNASPAAQAAPDNPDFYATIVGVTPQSSLVVSPTRDQLITIDVSQLGSTPWNEGAFALNNVILIRTTRVGDRLVAYGWEQARHGNDSFGSDDEQRENQQRHKDDDDKDKDKNK
jgi:hypothetical protein